MKQNFVSVPGMFACTAQGQTSKRPMVCDRLDSVLSINLMPLIFTHETPFLNGLVLVSIYLKRKLFVSHPSHPPPPPPLPTPNIKKRAGGWVGGGGLKKWENIAMQMIIARQFSEH